MRRNAEEREVFTQAYRRDLAERRRIEAELEVIEHQNRAPQNTLASVDGVVRRIREMGALVGGADRLWQCRQDQCRFLAPGNCVLTILAHEDSAEFHAFLDQYRAEFKPTSADQLAGQSPQLDNPDARIAAELLARSASAPAAIQRYATAAERSYFRARRELQQGRSRELRNKANEAQAWLQSELRNSPPPELPGLKEALRAELELAPVRSHYRGPGPHDRRTRLFPGFGSRPGKQWITERRAAAGRGWAVPVLRSRVGNNSAASRRASAKPP